MREGTLKHGKHNFSDVSDYYLFLLTDVILVAQVEILLLLSKLHGGDISHYSAAKEPEEENI